ncbi:MAG: hypothetical protein K2X99_11985, partial [Gemmatimonadaceae bacterium]|nr:hypothetical protein [Gemmatimonadaceae bacterium]
MRTRRRIPPAPTIAISVAAFAVLIAVVVPLLIRAPHTARAWGIVLGAIALVALAVALWFERVQAREEAERAEELEHLSSELLRANRAK